MHYFTGANTTKTRCLPRFQVGAASAARGGQDYLTLYVLGSWVFSANMGCKRVVTLQLVVLHHVLKRFTDGCSRSMEHPCAFRATPAQETLVFDPYQFSAHGSKHAFSFGAV